LTDAQETPPGGSKHVSAGRDDDRDGDAVELLIEELGDAYSPEYLRDCADDEARAERLEELKRRIALDAYRVDTDRIAEELLERGLLDKE
jgi:anti-sigma28 factor (negative regulator of flagellin synthesis)